MNESNRIFVARSGRRIYANGRVQKILCASSQNHEQVAVFAKLLKNSGWTHTYDWTSLLYDRTSHVQKTTNIKHFERHIVNKNIIELA